MSLREYRKLAEELGPLELVMISGGEPFLRADLARIVAVFYRQNGLRSVSVATNMLLAAEVERQTEKMLKELPGLRVVICPSLDGLEEDHDRSRGVPGAFVKFRETYRRLVKLQKKYPLLRLRPNAVIFNKSYRGLFNLIDRMEEFFPESWLLSLSLLRGEPREKGLRLPSEGEIRKIFEYKAKKFVGRRPFWSRWLERLVLTAQLKVLREKKQPVPCVAGRSLAVVGADGEVKLCEMRPAVGNLRRGGFGRVWQGKEAEKQREEIGAGKCACTHECFLFPSLAAHPVKAIKLVMGL